MDQCNHCPYKRELEIRLQMKEKILWWKQKEAERENATLLALKIEEAAMN